MVSPIKDVLRKSFLYAPVFRRMLRKVKGYLGDEGARYDDLAFTVMNRFISSGTNCIDVGCHNGLYLDQILRLAPDGSHHAFEPLPVLAEFLRVRYQQRRNVYIHDLALSNCSGATEFHFNTTNPGWSGIKRRSYPSEQDEVQVLHVEMRRLDEIIENEMRVDFLKLDVEGAELAVLEGARNTLRRHKPLVIFEYGLGSAEYYEAWPERMFDLLTESGLLVSTIETFLISPEPMTRDTFYRLFSRPHRLLLRGLL